MSEKDVVVIGGGLAGLSAAVALSEAGFRVRLFEKRERLGGRATSYQLPGGETIDNCQHVTLGCCTNLADFYRRVGVSDRIRSYRRLLFFDRRGCRGIIQPSPLPPPLHLAFSFARFPLLYRSEKRAIARLLLRIVRAGRPADAAGMTMLDWLRRQRQPEGAIRRFWRVVLVGALNEELDRAAAGYGIDVFWKVFLANRRGFELGVPTVPLAELYEGCRGVIERRGGQVFAGTGVREILQAEAGVTGVRLDDGVVVTGGSFLAAVPHHRLLRILPVETAARDPVFRELHNLRSSPITGIHLWFDRPVMSAPFAALLDHTVQWIFNKSLLLTSPPDARYADGGDNLRHAQIAGVGDLGAAPPGDDPRARPLLPAATGATAPQYLQLVVSASRSLIPLSRDVIVDLCRRELQDLLPGVKQAGLQKAVVIKETAATFSPEPGCDRWRPAQRTGLKHLFLAGDWTRTGWPATMEGAVRSGYLAAEAIMADAGLPQKLLQADLPAEGLCRCWAGGESAGLT